MGVGARPALAVRLLVDALPKIGVGCVPRRIIAESPVSAPSASPLERVLKTIRRCT